jgi:hypothetical protein
MVIIKCLYCLLLFILCSNAAANTQDDAAYEMAALKVADICYQKGLTTVHFEAEDMITMVVNKTGLSITDALKITEKRQTQMMATQYVNQIIGGIELGRLTCDDVVMFSIGGLMTK